MKSTRCLGNLWPTNVFTEHFEYSPDPKTLVSVIHNGAKYTGVLLSPSFGLEIGVIALNEESYATIERAWELADGSIGEFRPEALDSVWERGLKRHTVAAKVRKPQQVRRQRLECCAWARILLTTIWLRYGRQALRSLRKVVGHRQHRLGGPDNHQQQKKPQGKTHKSHKISRQLHDLKSCRLLIA